MRAPSASAMSVSRERTKFFAVASPSALRTATAPGRRSATTAGSVTISASGSSVKNRWRIWIRIFTSSSLISESAPRSSAPPSATTCIIALSTARYGYRRVRWMSSSTVSSRSASVDRRRLHREAVALGLGRPGEQLERLQADRQQRVRREGLLHQLRVALDLVHLADQRLDVEVQVLLAQAERRLQQRGGRSPEIGGGQQPGAVRADLRLLAPAEEEALAKRRQDGDVRVVLARGEQAVQAVVAEEDVPQLVAEDELQLGVLEPLERARRHADQRVGPISRMSMVAKALTSADGRQKTSACASTPNRSQTSPNSR